MVKKYMKRYLVLIVIKYIDKFDDVKIKGFYVVKIVLR